MKILKKAYIRLPKTIFSFFTFLLITLNSLADEPPNWREFSITSKNQKYIAKIRVTELDLNKLTQEKQWILEVYNLENDSSFLWKTNFHHDGYGGGVLSDDGKIYVYVNSWLDLGKHPNQIIIYTPDIIHRFSGKELNLDPTIFPHTVSHQIWMDNFYLSPNYLNDTSKLIIETKNLKQIVIVINSGEVSESILFPEFIRQNDWLKKIAIVILVLIGIGVAIITFKRFKELKIK